MAVIVDAPALLSVKVDDQSVEVPVGASALDAINAAGVYVPQLCKDPDQKARGACRTCLVQIEGVRGFPASCTTPCTDGMQISVASPEATRIRRGVIELTMGMHPDACQTNRPNTHNDLVDAARAHGIDTPRWAPLPDPSVDTSNPFFVLDMQQCILCARCVTACDEVQHIGAIALLGRGGAMKVGTFADQPLRESICTSCGSCFAACPTGAIYPKKVRAEPVKRVDTTCPYCGVGCAIKLDVSADDAIVRSDDQPANPSSQGMLCVKGRFGFEYVNHRDRLKWPLIRRNGQLEQASWDEALDLVADKLVEHRGSFGALASAKGTNEDAYIIQKFVRSVMDSNNVDHCTRLCHSPSVHAMLQSLGSGATSNSYVDYENAGCLMVVGSDSSSNHPVVTVRFRRAVKRGATLIVVNPKWTELNYYADIWLRQLPGHGRRAVQRPGVRAARRGPGRHGVHPHPHRRVRRVGRGRSRVSAGGHVRDHGRARKGPHRGRARLRQTALQWLVHDLGHGHQPALERHGQRPRGHQPGPGGGHGWQAGQRHLAVARSEQRAGLWRRRLHSRQPARVSSADRWPIAPGLAPPGDR